MSMFYGQVHGQAESTASRRGSAKSGISASVQSWNGSIILWLREFKDELWLDVSYDEGSSFRGHTLWDGPLEEFVNILSKAWKDEHDV